MRWMVVVLACWALGAVAAAQSGPLAAKAQAGTRALQEERFDDAAAIFQELVTALPAVPGLRMNWGMALHMAGRDAEAVAPLRQAFEADANLHPAGLFLGASLLRLGRAKEAIAPLERVAKANPAMLDARRLLADAYMAVGRPAAAIPHLQAILVAEPSDAGVVTGLAQIYESEAQASFARLRDVAPESSLMLALLGETRLAQRQYPSAFYLFREALDREACPPGVHAALAAIYAATGHADWAETEQALASKEPQPDCTQAPAACQFLRGGYGAVLDLTAGKDAPESLYWRTRALNELAAMTFARLSQLPPSAESHSILAQHFAARGQYPEAVKQWRAALELAPGDAAIRQGLAEALYGLRNYDEALGLVDGLVADEPGAAPLHWLRGDLLLALQRVEEAALALEKALALDGSLTPAHRSLGRALMDLGRDPEAIPHLEQALAVDEDGSVHFQLGRAYQAAGEREKAREMLAKYQEIQNEQRLAMAEREEEVRILPPPASTP